MSRDIKRDSKKIVDHDISLLREEEKKIHTRRNKLRDIASEIEKLLPRGKEGEIQSKILQSVDEDIYEQIKLEIRTCDRNIMELTKEIDCLTEHGMSMADRLKALLTIGESIIESECGEEPEIPKREIVWLQE